ncbi:VWA domain-containing protein [bacterium]|nr:VWA domain-containing protein [bacterium]
MDVFNPWMLLGLAGLIIPILVHLLARRKQDIVEWGAMQFLEPSPKQRRSLWLENFWLMLLRIGLIAVLTLALARPWWESLWLARLTHNRAQDIALIVDGSGSLERRLGNRTVGDDVRRLTRQVIDQLDESDALQIYDARESPMALLPGFRRDRAAAKEALLDIPVPTGSANLPAAITLAMRDLLQTGNLDRDIVIVTDQQSRSWRTSDVAAWQSLDAMRQQARVAPRFWVLLTENESSPPAANLALGPIRLSRELAMPGSVVRVSAPIRSFHSPDPVTCEVALDIDGIASPQHISTVRVPGNGETPIEFEVVLDRPGCHALTLRLQHDDELPNDQTSTAVIEVGSGWPVLLVDGSPASDPVQSELYFLAAAFDAGTDSWIQATHIPMSEFDATTLSKYAAVVLANVADVPEDDVLALDRYVQQGGVVLLTLGNQMTATPAAEPIAWQRWLPVRLDQIGGDPDDADAAISWKLDSLQLPWQERFARQRSGGLNDVRFSRWWDVTPQNAENQPTPQPWSLFSNGQPALLAQSRGLGTVAVWTSSIDADWNTFPSKPDYVAWWHEVLFALLDPVTHRNVNVGEPLVVTCEPGLTELRGSFLTPTGRSQPGEAWSQNERVGCRLPSARWPGLYPFLPDRPGETAAGPSEKDLFSQCLRDAFAASADIQESDLTPLSDGEREQLTANRPLRFVESAEDLGTAWVGDAGRTELAPWLLYLLLVFLVMEVLMTRRMIRHQSSSGQEFGA